MRKFVKEIVENIPRLTHDERGKVRTALDNVNDLKKICDIIESTQDENPHCPHCGKTRVHKHGTRAGLQRYKCTGCGRTFNALTKTPLARMRKKELWLSYMDCMLNSMFLRGIGDYLHVDKKTAFLWRHRFSSWLYKDTPKMLEGIVEADETFFRHSQKGCRHIKRNVHKRGGDGAPRGVSKQKICVLTAADRSAHCLEFITGRGAVKGKWLDLMLSNRIAKDAILVTDGHSSYSSFCNHNHVDHVIVMNKKGRRTVGPYHIQHINAFHGRLKLWINGGFKGVATKYLNHYLWWRHELENKHITDAISLFRACLC